MDKIAVCFENAWNDAIKRYENYGERDSPYWYEQDVLIHLVNFFNKRLEQEALNGLDVHANVKLSTSDWEECKILQEKEKILLKRLKKWCERELVNKKISRDPHIDILAFDLAEVEKRPHPFDLAAEIKFSGYQKTKKKGLAMSRLWQIRYDVYRLKALLELGICRNAFFCYLDEFHLKEDDVRGKLEEEVGNKKVNVCYSLQRSHFQSK